SLQRIANKPRRGIGDASLARLQAHADAHELSLWEALGHAEEAGIAAAPLKAVQQFHGVMQSLQSAAQELTVAELLERVLDRTGYLAALEAERTIESQGRIENLQELVGVAQEYQHTAAEPSLSTGDSVRHETLGEGVVTAIEAGGVVTVRFAGDGSERRLMLDYAPLEKIA